MTKPATKQTELPGTAPNPAALISMKAAAPLKAKKPQEFDLGALPLFGDQAKQKELAL